jgi:flavin reductase (DIM6/NTAB) family NADH-FMN oxidoreductase RutF
MIDVRAFHRRFLTGVTILITFAGEEPRGMTTNAISSVSIEPPVLPACVARTAGTHEPLVRAKRFALNILAADQAALAQRFARSGHGKKFDGVAWRRGRFGAPVLVGTCAHLEAQVEREIEVYTHTVFVGRVLQATAAPGRPLAYLAGGLGDPATVMS